MIYDRWLQQKGCLVTQAAFLLYSAFCSRLTLELLSVIEINAQEAVILVE